MGAHLKVESQQLDRLLKQLHDSQDEMRRALNSLRDIGPKSTGSEALDNACEELHDSWDDAIDKISDGTGQIEKMVHSTKKGYDGIEHAIHDAIAQASRKAAPKGSQGAHHEAHRNAHVAGGAR